MPESIREQIIAEFARRMGATRNGRDVAVALYTGPDTVERSYYGWTDRNLPIRIDYVADLTPAQVASDTLVQQRSEQLLATCLETAMQDQTLGGLCDAIIFVDSEPAPRERGSTKLPLIVNFAIRYTAKTNDPYMTVED